MEDTIALAYHMKQSLLSDDPFVSAKDLAIASGVIPPHTAGGADCHTLPHVEKRSVSLGGAPEKERATPLKRTKRVLFETEY